MSLSLRYISHYKVNCFFAIDFKIYLRAREKFFVVNEKYFIYYYLFISIIILLLIKNII